MERLERYRQLIQTILTNYHQWAANGSDSDVQDCLAFDEERDRYFWFQVGWQGKRRAFSVMVYLRIEAGKIWVEEDWTKQGIVNDLLAAGVLKEDVVLGFQHPSKRALTEFAAV